MTSYTREEEALDDFLAKQDGVVAVVYSEPFHPGSESLANRARSLGEQTGKHVIVVGPESHRTWAAHHGVFGTPAMLVFRNGNLVQRLHGVLPESQLIEFATRW